MNAMPFADPWTTSGGKALAFHSSVRIRLKHKGRIKQKVHGQNRIIGIKVKAQIVKNRMGPPLRSAEFDVYFDSGIDNYGSWLTVLKDSKIVKQNGAWYSYTPDNGDEKLKFQSKDFVEMLDEDDELRAELYEKICDATVLKYKTGPVDPDDVEVDESESED